MTDAPRLSIKSRTYNYPVAPAQWDNFAADAKPVLEAITKSPLLNSENGGINTTPFTNLLQAITREDTKTIVPMPSPRALQAALVSAFTYAAQIDSAEGETLKENVIALSDLISIPIAIEQPVERKPGPRNGPRTGATSNSASRS